MDEQDTYSTHMTHETRITDDSSNEALIVQMILTYIHDTEDTYRTHS